MRANTRTALVLSAVAATMLGGAFASKPLYDAFCRATGFGGEVRRAATGAGEIRDREVVVRFDANVAEGVLVEFAPLQRQETLRLGQNGLAYFRVANPTDAPVAVIATFNVTPFKAAPYFRKIECFCFTEQTLEPGEVVEMPVVFYVDPALAEQASLEDVTTITLSYTYFGSLTDAADRAAESAASNGPAGPERGEG
jgi:cytochrome c oxidase assembly protein subunit 11